MNMTRCVSALMALGLALGACTPLAEVRIRNTEGDEAFLDDVQRRTFAWFWETTADSTGLVPDRHPSRTFSSVAAVGFGLTAYGIGAERGYITRVEAAERTLAALRFFWESPHGETPAGVIGHRGFFYHFLEFETGHRFRETELSTIDTALLMAGVLFALMSLWPSPWLLLAIMPVNLGYLIVLFLVPGSCGANRYGEPPALP